MKMCKSLDEKDMTNNEAYSLWIWRVIRNGFIARTSGEFIRSDCRFKDKCRFTVSDGTPTKLGDAHFGLGAFHFLG